MVLYRRSFLLLLSLLIVCLVTACADESAATTTPATTTAPSASPAAGSSPTPASIQAAVAAIIGGLDAADPASLDRAEDLVRMGRPAAQYLLPLLESPVLLERWAAGYYFSRLAEVSDMPQLVAALDDTHVSNRTVIAGTLLRLGDRQGIPVLQ